MRKTSATIRCQSITAELSIGSNADRTICLFPAGGLLPKPHRMPRADYDPHHFAQKAERRADCFGILRDHRHSADAQLRGQFCPIHCGIRDHVTRNPVSEPVQIILGSCLIPSVKFLTRETRVRCPEPVRVVKSESGIASARRHR